MTPWSWRTFITFTNPPGRGILGSGPTHLRWKRDVWQLIAKAPFPEGHGFKR